MLQCESVAMDSVHASALPVQKDQEDIFHSLLAQEGGVSRELASVCGRLKCYSGEGADFAGNVLDM